ncbi:hypothetical protein K461DRAFT_316381 [Myriangium duriaei CBS 260.36]|uniref:Mid2 domain-containing protein n=1 Tax=Myriangium duriaei CBS 260.36 TaxID=1168546 RepID=A0A9P4IW92_9PEZI|nr:hypothetical protein K461DRAFT_316381 [Myriangium duriaei CBS 260.36]
MLALLLYAATWLLPVHATARCYFPDGTTLQGPEFVPCNSFNSSNSYCCGAGRVENASAGIYPDACLPNGLCSGHASGALYWREGCSNPDWPEDVCPRNVCEDPSENDINGNAPMTPCDGTNSSSTWCCGANTTSCCGKGSPSEITLRPTLVAVISSTTSSTSPSSTSTSSATQSSSPPSSSSTQTSTSSQASGLSTGAKAGIGVGVALGAVLAFAGLIFFVLAWRRKKQSYSFPDNKTRYTGQQAEYAQTYSLSSSGPEQAYAHYKDAPVEMDSGPGAYELDPTHTTDSQIHQLPDSLPSGHNTGKGEKR